MAHQDVVPVPQPERWRYPPFSIGNKDSRHMALLTNDIYRYSPLLLGPADIAAAHGRDERISIESFGRMLTFYQQVLVGGSANALP
jgi:carboxypeptidase PM20D1